MAINIPLVHISDLTEKKTISDSDYMLTGGSTASKHVVNNRVLN